MTGRTARGPEPNESVELGDEIRLKTGKGTGPVVAVRMPRDLLARINRYAQDHGTTVSDVLRQGAESMVSGVTDLGPVYVSGVTVHGPRAVTGTPSFAVGYLWTNLEIRFRSKDEPESIWNVRAIGG